MVKDREIERDFDSDARAIEEFHERRKQKAVAKTNPVMKQVEPPPVPLEEGEKLADLKEETNTREYIVRPTLSLVQDIYHQASAQEPEQVSARYSRVLSDNEQMYRRKTTLTDEWRLLDVGWVNNIGLVVIHNDEGSNFRNQPSSHELMQVAQRVIEVCFIPKQPPNRDMHSPAKPKLLAHIIVRPGELVHFEPDEGAEVMWRCRFGSTRCTLYVVPA